MRRSPFGVPQVLMTLGGPTDERFPNQWHLTTTVSSPPEVAGDALARVIIHEFGSPFKNVSRLAGYVEMLGNDGHSSRHGLVYRTWVNKADGALEIRGKRQFVTNGKFPTNTVSFHRLAVKIAVG